MDIFYYFFGRICKSAIFFLGNIFQKREFDIVFYFPAHFNRNKDGSNPFFYPFFELCNKHNISFIAIEEPIFFKKYKSKKNYMPFDTVFFFIIFLRKVIPLSRFESFEERDQFIARCIKPLFFRRFYFKNYIVLSNSMLAFFRGLGNNASLYDYQHGIIHSLHDGYLKEGHPRDHIKKNKVNLLLYGTGFYDILKNNDKESYYKKHAYVIGTTIHTDEKHSEQISTSNRNILFSLQLIDGKDPFDIEQYKFILDFFLKYQTFFESHSISIFFKDHPRYNNSIDMSQLYELPYTKKISGTLEQALNDCFLHMTLFSTTIFDAAHKHIPTLLLDNPCFPTNIVYDKDYQYPLGVDHENDIINHINKYIENNETYISSRKVVNDWYKKFYKPFDEKMFLSLFKRNS